MFIDGIFHSVARLKIFTIFNESTLKNHDLIIKNLLTNNKMTLKVHFGPLMRLYLSTYYKLESNYSMILIKFDTSEGGKVIFEFN